MLKVACDALQIEFKCSDSIKGNAGAVLHMQYQRGHASIHRDLTGRLGELRILCILERQRQQNLPQQDVSVLEALDWLEDQLNRCEQQLQKHKEMMERMEEEDDILFASNLEQQARTIADNLSALLKAVANRRSSIPGALSEEEAAQSEAMQGHLKVVAYRAIGEAAAAGGRAVGMLKSAEEQRPGDSTLPWSQQAEGSKLSQLPRLRSTDVAQMISAMLKQFENVHAAMRKPVHAKEQTQERRSSSDALIEELLRASRTAAETSAAFLNEAQFMWLHAQLNASLELDMQLSATLAQRATAAVGMAAGEQPKQQHWHVEVPAVDIQVFENLLEQFKNVEEDAQSATALNQMALAATRMKQAALKLTMFVDERQKQPR
ncbi:uncharacterized protein EMH_0091670 [Eimeria mitis]|uniref:Uncharacterized protein n=1 Tax=Eimeria mitis TaxID=44415 RepID=U6KMB5_9EIME|nr:uncharacterized protein EMH_0091670 [Eimeria mitis]CDJ36598.1 hypothetical protein EMH_0091670 [Eimeria mitis]